MAHKNAVAGKAWEREVARLLNCPRKWANSGEKVDNEGDDFVIQCKAVQQLSLTQLIALCEQAVKDGVEHGKMGIVAVRQRLGTGRVSTPIVAMTIEMFACLQARLGRPGENW